MTLVKYVISLVAALALLIYTIYYIQVKHPELIVKHRIITIKGDTFDLNVTVIVTESIPVALKYVRENLDSTVTAADFDARAVSFPTIDGKSPIIWMADTKDKGVVAHELFHTALNVMYWTGMELNSETEEAFAYEIQYLTNSFYNQINTIQ